MLIYEKDNKLNISFENQLENPDFEISKEEVNLGNANIVSGGSGSGGGSGNTLTLYADGSVVYKDKDLEQLFETFEEAVAAVKNAGVIKVEFNENFATFAVAYNIRNDDTYGKRVSILCVDDINDSDWLTLYNKEQPK